MAQGLQLQSLNNHSATNNSQSIKKTGKQHSIGMTGRNRTATALLVGSASASSEPVLEAT